ncbi:tetrapyrrole methylase family protein / MazG family protein [Selenomonas ruminantium]|uniref:Tetrapyrrole methylase family protein / MazG family protein n=1 Tax=Selenomonas ruminantium TaxID=971 RepID=A0A1M6SRB0_SELRU|nr:MazG nucleotide pyrophosphohydrolase domain-containing protein [Selenomonas ruminantium]SHK47167.1 tetrapyrrole methylase family protein / MazG family protein [Selenomonas ruminantium]
MSLDGLRRLQHIVKELRGEGGCPWDREQTHESLKPACIEEAAEVLAGIDILTATGKAENLKEELGDLLLQVVFHAQLAEEAGLFNLDDVAKAASDKMERRHPHVFAGAPVESVDWEAIKKAEKAGREWEEDYLPGAFDQAAALIERARKRKQL